MRKIKIVLTLTLVFCIGIATIGCNSQSVTLPVNPDAPSKDQLLSELAKDSLTEATDLIEVEYKDVQIGENFDFSRLSNFVKIDVKDYGSIIILLRPDVAPITVNNFKKLVHEGFYNGLTFHRAVKGTMIEGGEIDADGVIHDTDMIYGEFAQNNFTNNLPHIKGVISMSRKNIPDSAAGGFFIVCGDAPQLDGRYAAFGYVIEGMEIVEAIENAEVGANDAPTTPIVIEKITFMEILKKDN